jgi:hypothetical protein
MCSGGHYGENVNAPRRLRLPAHTRFFTARIEVWRRRQVSSRAIFSGAKGKVQMGFLDKAKEAAQQASVKAKEAAEQAQKKLEEKQAEFNERQAERAREQDAAASGQAPPPPPPADTGPTPDPAAPPPPSAEAPTPPPAAPTPPADKAPDPFRPIE